MFGDKVAVRGLSLQVRRGEVFGFLGPNGAGKSTSVKMLLGLVTPSSGIARVLGQAAGHRSTRARIGFLPEHFRFYDWLTAAELLRVHGRLYGMTGSLLRERIPVMLEAVGLSAQRDKQLRKFSKGMLQRIGLAQALMNKPDLLFLDEPTSGLDPSGRRLVRDLIKSQRERGATVFLNSHLLSEVEITCDRVAFIRAGEVLEVRDMESFAGDRITVTMRARGLSGSVLESLASRTSHLRLEGERAIFSLETRDELPHLLRFLVERGVQVYEFTPQKLSLEERFLELLGDEAEA